MSGFDYDFLPARLTHTSLAKSLLGKADWTDALGRSRTEVNI
uniref:Uncharacterized protein n=1 Tax=Siphoviridae sp. ctSA812 TaxID=2825508 RepID=A0A8S5U3M0_9CAUD|nr:MAG TPA: hypothetical protein [Siphoviridae sp. ctSA812]